MKGRIGQACQIKRRSKKRSSKFKKQYDKAKAQIKKRNETCVFGRKIKELEQRLLNNE